MRRDASLKTYSCSFVLASDLYAELPRVAKILSSTDSAFSWGDNNRTMITPKRLYDAIDAAVTVVDDSEMSTDEDSHIIGQEEWDRFAHRIESLPTDVYIDLEN